MKAGVLYGDRDIRLGEVPDPVCGPDDILIESAYAGLCGTDLHIYRGEMRGRVKIAPIKAGNIEVHWPEGSVLLDHEVIDLLSMEPDYNARVKVERVDGAPIDGSGPRDGKSRESHDGR